MPFEPGLYAGMLVGALIVEDQMGSSQAGVSSFSWGNGWTPDDDGAADQPDVEYTSSSYEETTQRNSQVYDLFLKEFGSVLCRDIQNNLFGKSYNVETAKEVSELNSLNRGRFRCHCSGGKTGRNSCFRKRAFEQQWHSSVKGNLASQVDWNSWPNSSDHECKIPNKKSFC